MRKKIESKSDFFMTKTPWNKNKSIGQKIKECREQLNLTQEELGKKLGISQNTINQYENKNWKNPSAKVVYKLAVALGVPVIYLMDDDCQVLDDVDEEVLLVKYRKLAPDKKKLVIEIVKIMGEFNLT
jgi:HTH-type transcriptional regulator / antitoxin HipB